MSGVLDRLREYREKREQEKQHKAEERYLADREKLKNLRVREQLAKTRIEVQDEENRIRMLERKSSVAGRIGEKISQVKQNVQVKEAERDKKLKSQLRGLKRKPKRRKTKTIKQSPPDMGLAGLFGAPDTPGLFDTSGDVSGIMDLYAVRDRKGKKSKTIEDLF